jgi:hypothetical protein
VPIDCWRSSVACYIPLDKIVGEGLVGEAPAPVDLGGDLERVLAGEDGELEDAAGVDELLAREGVDVHGVAVVREEQLVHGVRHAELPVGGDDERLHHGVGVEPVADALVPAVVVHVDVGLGQAPHPGLGAGRRRRVHRALGGGDAAAELRQAQLDGHRGERAVAAEEQQRPAGVDEVVGQAVDLDQERHVVVVVVQDVEPVALQRLLHGEALQAPLDVRRRDGARVVAVLARVEGALGRELLMTSREHHICYSNNNWPSSSRRSQRFNSP